MQRRFNRTAGFALTAVFGLVGCVQNLVPAIPTGNQSGDALNPLASTEVASGFAQAAGETASASNTANTTEDAPAVTARPDPLGLSQDLRDQLEELQSQLDSGDLTAEEFAQKVDALISQIAPRPAFAGRGFLGRAFGGPLRGALAEKLNLTDQQKADAKKIFTDLHHNIRLAVIEALANMRLQLTDAQRKQLDELRDSGFAAIRGQLTTAAGGAAPAGKGGVRGRIQSFFERLAATLKLTDAQRTAITGIRDDLRNTVRTLHQDARTAFRALLTDEQLQILDQIESSRPHHPDEHDGDATGADDSNESN